MGQTHRPVLLDEVLAQLNIRQNGTYVDATFGRGGHSRQILSRLDEAGRLLVLDRDPEAIAEAQKSLSADPRVRIHHAPFAQLETVAAEEGLQAGVDGLLLDLGVSSPQLEDPERGFSFSRTGPLDMRMDPAAGQSAAEWIARASEREISAVLKEFGEEKFHRRIARAIVHARDKGEVVLDTTSALAGVVSAARPHREHKRHPATRTFQAIRIFINRELEQLELCLEQSLRILAPGGRLCVISFHSLEDRIVKRFMRRNARPDPMFAGLPDIPPEAKPLLRLIGKAIRPGHDEVAANPRARSAILRVAERLP